MRTLDLPSPDQLRAPWAAFAAICAARGWASSAYAEGERWHFDDGGGNWGDLVHVGAGRAVLVGNDHEYSDTYFREAATYFQEDETDLLAGAPDWWEPPVVAGMEREMWVGFVYGYDGGWRRAEYDKSDGFESLGHPAFDRGRCVELVESFTTGAPGLAGAAPSRAAIEALIDTDAQPTEAQLRAVIGPHGWDAEAGMAAARAFRR